MHDAGISVDQEEWVIWNGNNGLVTTVMMGRIEIGVDGRWAWLDEPFDMVGPISLAALETNGRIAFAECIVMSRQRWQKDQVELRQAALKVRRAAERRASDKAERLFDRGDGREQSYPIAFDQRRHRQALHLPSEGKLESSQIKTAFRRLAQKAHPDVGGSHEAFVRIAEARDMLLAGMS